MVTPADDLPSGTLAALSMLKAEHGKYPALVYVSVVVGLLHNMQPGVWTRRKHGLWAWDSATVEKRHLKK